MSGEPREVLLAWRGDLAFEGGASGGPTVRLDGSGATGPSPMDTLLLALAGCTGADVAHILRKMRAELRSLSIAVTGERSEENPRRYVAISLTYRINAPGLDEEGARRAIDLSLGKYCSVAHSLASDLPIRYELALEA